MNASDDGTEPLGEAPEVAPAPVKVALSRLDRLEDFAADIVELRNYWNACGFTSASAATNLTEIMTEHGIE